MPRPLLVVTDQRMRDHEPPRDHPDSVDRLEAVRRAIDGSAGIEAAAGRLATMDELELVHSSEHIRFVRDLSEAGGGPVDRDTFASSATYTAARAAVGAGLVAVERLRADPGLTAAFVVTRPPGHHASATSAKGFCFFNNVAVAATSLARTGERVAIIDWDAHHGSGTQDIFWDDDRVLYVSLHQENLYPGTGLPHERGPMPGHLSTVNLPLPAGATGDRYLELLDTVVSPIVSTFDPSWVLVSCGFDAHSNDPLAEMALGADDFALFTETVQSLVPASGRLLLFLEGGYDIEALETSTRAVFSTLTNTRAVAPVPTTGGPGALRVKALQSFWEP